MKIGICSYPMLYQRIGGAQVQLFETVDELGRLGIEARHFDYLKHKITDLDVIHVIGTIQGNHKIVEAARQTGVPVVLSSIFTMPWSRRDFGRARFAARLTGRLTGWKIRTEFDAFESAVRNADCVIALGEEERRLVVSRFRKPAGQVVIVPNGVSRQFFAADPGLARAKLGFIDPFVLCAAAIKPFKGQLRLIDAAITGDFRLVLAGPIQDQSYFDACMARGGDRVTYVGAIEHDDPMLASLFAAASVSALASNGECSPVSLIECLAAGTPFALTKNHSVELKRDARCWVDFDQSSPSAILSAVNGLLREKPSEACRQLVVSFTWESVARQIAAIYDDVLERTAPDRQSSSAAAKFAQKREASVTSLA